MIPIGTNLKLKNIPKVTVSLIAINTCSFIFFSDILASDTDLILYLVSFFSTFIHADIFHLFFNMLFLWVFGSYLEDKIGSKLFLLYYFISKIGSALLHIIANGNPSIGASGAISGIMGIYLYRCYYSKIKTIVPLFIYYLKVNINAKWLLLFWFLRDIYDAFYAVDNVAHWAHIGGFLTGIIISNANKYARKAKKEHLYERATDSIDKRWGLADAEKDLLEILKLSPENPKIHLELARLYAMHDDGKEKASKYYLNAAKFFYLGEKERSLAGEVFLEYLTKYREPIESDIHLKYANTLSNVCDYNAAAKILEPLIDRNVLKKPIGEMIFLHYISSSLKAGLQEPADYALEKFKKIFPGSPLLKEAESLRLSFKPEVKHKLQIEKATGAGWRYRVMDELNETTSDPLYWLILLILLNLSDFILIIPLAILAFAVTLMARGIASFSGSLYGGFSKSEAQGIREFNLAFFMDKATACERQGNYKEAVEYLKEVLKEDRENFGLRYSLARLYHKKLNEPLKAVVEYRIVLKTAPDHHPFKRDAYHSIKELSQPHASYALNEA